MMRIDDEILMAFVDGELDEVRRGRIERAAAEDPELRERIEAQRRLRATIAAHYAPVVDEEVPDRLRAILEGNVVDLASARQKHGWPRWQNLGAIAASLVVGLFAGQMLPIGSDGPVAVEEGGLVARGELARALDTQLASAQSSEAGARIGVSFASTDGRICRTFDSSALAGLACHESEGWRLIVTAPGSAGPSGDYRQAGSGGLIVMQAAQEMMAGEPLDAEAERRSRDSGWSAPSAAD